MRHVSCSNVVGSIDSRAWRMTQSAPLAGAGLREALRLFRHETTALRDAGPSLETTVTPPEPPRVVNSDVIESTTVRAHRVDEPPTVGFSAFLDGVQESHVIHYADGIPVVCGRVSAVVRHRLLRRLVTWKRPLVRCRLYVPRALVSPTIWSHAIGSAFEVVDTTEATDAAGASLSSAHDAHPFTVAQRALEAVKRDRERAERQLAEDWCATQTEPLFVDGSIATSDRVSRSPFAVGVIKSHRTLYVTGAAMRVVQSLPLHHRSSVIRVEAYHRTSVASWYLRVRDATGRDPMWGLLRVETTLPDKADAPQVIAARANLISRWILAESTPLSLPDGRWDKMVYGIRDCEEFLRALG
jgi:hypothetical protein